MKTGFLLAFILAVLLQKVSNEEILTELNKILDKIPTEQRGSDDLVAGFVSFDSIIIDKIERGKTFPLKINNSFEERFKNEKFSVGHYTVFHLLDFLAIDEAENYLVIGTVDKDAPNYVKFALIQTKVRIISKDYYIYKNLLEKLNGINLESKYSKCITGGRCPFFFWSIILNRYPDLRIFKDHRLTFDELVRRVQELSVSSRGNLQGYIDRAFSDCSNSCKRISLFFSKNKQKREACFNECNVNRQNTISSLRYKMSLEVREVLKKKFASTAFRTQILNYFNKGVFQTENIFKILKTEIQKLETKSPENIYNYVLNTDVLTNYVSDVTRKGDYSKYNLNNAIKSQLEMLQFTSQVDLKAFNFEAQLSAGEYEQVIGVGIVDPNDQNLVHLTFFQARAKSKLRQQYKYPYPDCTKKYYTTNLERVTYPSCPRFFKKCREKLNQFVKDYPKECFKEERGLLPSEILIIKTGMKSHAYKALKNKIERVYVK